ncbi:MAG: cytochrome c [Hymenobacter sp.]|nr:MAG: cytochrome c [Hymenobacter sp.]
MKVSSTIVLLLALAGRAVAGPPAPGLRLYRQNCARCHGADGRLGASGAHDLTKSNLNAMGRTYLVTNGMGKMPAFSKELTPAEIEQVVAYSLTLK